MQTSSHAIDQLPVELWRRVISELVANLLDGAAVESEVIVGREAHEEQLDVPIDFDTVRAVMLVSSDFHDAALSALSQALEIPRSSGGR
jgi:hypothetical protein